MNLSNVICRRFGLCERFTCEQKSSDNVATQGLASCIVIGVTQTDLRHLQSPEKRRRGEENEAVCPKLSGIDRQTVHLGVLSYPNRLRIAEATPDAAGQESNPRYSVHSTPGGSLSYMSD